MNNGSDNKIMRRSDKKRLSKIMMFINGAIIIAAFVTHPKWIVLCFAEIIFFKGVCQYIRSDYPSVSEIVFSVIWGGITAYLHFCMKRNDLFDVYLIVVAVMIIFGFAGTKIAFVLNYISFRDSRRRTLNVDALIIDYDETTETYSDADGGAATAKGYRALYEFSVDGMTFQKYGKKKSSLPPKRGEYKKLLVNPKDPDDFGETIRYNPALGIGYFVLGIVVLIIGYFAADYVADFFKIDFQEFLKMLV